MKKILDKLFWAIYLRAMEGRKPNMESHKNTRTGMYILNGHEPVPIEDSIAWATLLGTMDRVVNKTVMDNGVTVSTVFLGLDHGWNKEPLLFETMVFGGKMDGVQNRYTTWEQAEEGHKKMVATVMEASKALTK